MLRRYPRANPSNGPALRPPKKEIDALRDYERSFVVIVKDGTIYENTLDQRGDVLSG